MRFFVPEIETSSSVTSEQTKRVITKQLSVLTLKELIQGVVGVTHNQHRSHVRLISPEFLVGQECLSNL